MDNAVRNRRLQHATPPWASRHAMAEIYRQARAMRAAGHDVHVDHVIPLRGELVCGLHWEGNLEIIPAIDNMKKGRKLPASR